MNEIKVKAYGKINIGLDVTGRREDGYHLVRMIMQTVKLHDTLTITKREDMQITMDCNKGSLPTDDSNLCVKAAKIMIQNYGIKHGYHIRLKKRIPVAAGMAGGSTDAAAVMTGINELEKLYVKRNDLMRLSLPIGADVPYCILQGTALAEGIGEELKKLKPVPKCYVLIAKPPISVSTKEVYTALDANQSIKHPDIDGIIDAIDDGDLKLMCNRMGNVLQTVTIPLHPEIEIIKDIMMENGALGSMMSGSGPTVFGIFDDEKKFNKCAKILKISNLTEAVHKTKMYRHTRKNDLGGR